MTKDEIIHLAERIVSGIATDEEILLYNKVMNAFADPTDTWDEHTHGNKMSMQAEMKRVINKRVAKSNQIFVINKYRWVAVASLLLILGAGYFFINKIKDYKQPVISGTRNTEEYKNDADPGRQGAILTLNNGQKILLDSAGNGSLGLQGSSAIIKKNGQISYADDKKSDDVVYNTMSTPNGRQYHLVLADGTKVWLNAASSITFPTAFRGKERKVMTEGEVYFEVAQDHFKSFIVTNGEVQIRVVGTHFNVNGYKDQGDVQVTLLEGSVNVGIADLSKEMTPMQQAQINEKDIKIIKNANVDVVMAWKNGFFKYEGVDLEIILKQLSRWYNVEVVYKKKVEDLFYAEIPRSTKLSDALRALELTGKVKFEISGKNIIVSQ